MIDSKKIANIISSCDELINTSISGLPKSGEPCLFDALSILTVIVCSGFGSTDAETHLAAKRDLIVLEYILKTKDKNFSFNLKVSNVIRHNCKLQASILNSAIDCFSFLYRVDQINMFCGIFSERGLTFYSSNNADAATKYEVRTRLKTQNRKLRDCLENPFDKELTPFTYSFIEQCSMRYGMSDFFRKTRWHSLIKARTVWMTKITTS